jgi:glycosyltransferase involved in cell wall biosynthesis
MKLSCIICSYNREKYIGDALVSLASQENFDYNKAEFVLVNNNSSDNTGQICEKFRDDHPELNIRYFLETQQGLSHARNRGITESQGDVCIFLDDDAVAGPGYLNAVYNFFESTPDAAAMGGKIIPKYEGKKPAWASEFLIPVFSVIDRGPGTSLFSDRHYPVGANMSIRRELFSKHGLFNPELGRRGGNMEGGEEKDIFLRFRATGAKIYYHGEAWVWHLVPVSRTSVQFLKKQALGIGFSERRRTESKGGGATWSRFFEELFKWGASFWLCLFYLITLRPAAGFMLLRFRWWVTTGFVWKKL